MVNEKKFELYIPPLFKHIKVPKSPDNLLPALDIAPLGTINNTPEKKMQRKIEHIRGPETIHNTFLHGQYGIIVGGQVVCSTIRLLIDLLHFTGTERLPTAPRSPE